MRRSGGTLLIACCCWSGLIAAPVLAREPAPRADQRLVRKLIRMIRHDARQQVTKGAVTVTSKCCGVRVLRVHYEARPSPRVLEDAYVLTLETRRGRVEMIAVGETVDEEERTTSTVDRKSSFEYALERIPRSSRWREHPNFSEGSTVDNGPGQPSWGASGARECSGGRRPAATGYYREMLMVLHNARRHLSSATKVHPSRYC